MNVNDTVLKKIEGELFVYICWKRLEKLYSSTIEIKEFQLIKKLFSITYKGLKNINQYINLFDETLKNLHNIGYNMPDDLVVKMMIFQLSSLFESF